MAYIVAERSVPLMRDTRDDAGAEGIRSDPIANGR